MHLRIIACLVILTLLAACGGRSGETPAQSPTLDRLPPFPLMHGPSAITSQTLLGIEASSRSAGAEDQGNSQFLDASDSDYEYALYRFHLAELPTELDVNLSSGEVYVLLPDNVNLVWEILGPFSNPLNIGLGQAKYVNGLGDTWVGIVVAAGGSAVVDALTLTGGEENQLPTAALSADPETGPAPLNVTLDASASSDPDGSIVLYEWDYTDNGSYDSAGAADSALHIYNSPGSRTCRLRVTDNDGATDEDTVTVIVGEPLNQPPLAEIIATPPDGTPPQHVDFDAGGSSDPDGSITQFEWDLDGDGVFELNTGLVATSFVDYTDPGAYTVSVRVSDDDGDNSVASFRVIMHGWVKVVADPAPDTGQSPSLLVINGKPAIAHYDYGNQELKYAASSTDLGAAPGDWQSITVDNTANGVGLDPSLALIGGNPAIAYTDNATARQKYARSSTPEGLSPTDWTAVVINGPAVNGGQHPSLFEVAGNPAVAYYDNMNGQNLLYRRASTATGTDPADWLGSVPVDFSGDVGDYPSLRVVNGNPAIAYQSECSTTRHLKYARSSTPTGTNMADWSQIVVVNATDFTGWSNEMKIVNGKPAIAYWGTTSDVYYAHSTTTNGSNALDWLNVSVSVDAVASAIYPSLAVVATKPVIAFLDETNKYLLYSLSSTVDGDLDTDWGADTPVDNTIVAGVQGCSAAGVQGKLAIAFNDDGNDHLIYAILL